LNELIQLGQAGDPSDYFSTLLDLVTKIAILAIFTRSILVYRADIKEKSVQSL